MAGSGLDLGVFLANNSEFKVRVSSNDVKPDYLINKFSILSRTADELYLYY